MNKYLILACTLLLSGCAEFNNPHKPPASAPAPVSSLSFEPSGNPGCFNVVIYVDGVAVDSRELCNGVSPVIGIIDPCGDAPGKKDEVIIQLSDGTLLATVTDRSGTRLIKLTPGTYSTRDGTGCSYTVNGEGKVL